MKTRHQLRGFLSGFLLASLLLGAAAFPSLASSATRMIEVFTGVRVYVNDLDLDAGDTHGNPEAFIYNGTTYIAAAAVSKSLGQAVKWDGDTRSVYIGKHLGSTTWLLDVCPPYQKDGFTSYVTAKMAGETYAHVFCPNNDFWSDGSYALFNLNGQYTTLSFDLGHLDGQYMYNATYRIYLDGELAFSVDLDPEALPRHYDVPLNGAIQMKIECTKYGGCYAMANLAVS